MTHYTPREIAEILMVRPGREHTENFSAQLRLVPEPDELKAQFNMYTTTIETAEHPRSINQAIRELYYLGFDTDQINAFVREAINSFFNFNESVTSEIEAHSGRDAFGLTSVGMSMRQDYNMFLAYHFDLQTHQLDDSFDLDATLKQAEEQAFEVLRRKLEQLDPALFNSRHQKRIGMLPPGR